MRSFALLFGISGAAVLLGIACTGSDPDLDNGSTSSSGGSSGAGGDAASGCPGDSPTACGPSCTTCAEPTGGGRATCTGGTCGIACDAPKIACGNACVDLANDAESCGLCGRKCGTGSTCAEGRCSTQVVADVPATLHEIAVAGSNVFYSLTTASPISSEIRRVAKTGGTPVVFHTTTDPQQYAIEVRPRTLTADVQKLYWGGTTSGLGVEEGIYEQALAGAGAVRIARHTTGAPAAVSGNLAAWAVNGNTIYACAPSVACAQESDLGKLLRASTSGLEFLVVDSGNVYWTESGGSVHVSSAPGNQTALAQTPRPFHLAVHDGSLYWTDHGIAGDATKKPGVHRCKLPGCGGSATKLVEWDAPPSHLAVDASGIYFSVPGDGAASGAIVVCRDLAAGCMGATKPAILVANAEHPDDLEVDSAEVFFATHPTDKTGKILRVAK